MLRRKTSARRPKLADRGARHASKMKATHVLDIKLKGVQRLRMKKSGLSPPSQPESHDKKFNDQNPTEKKTCAFSR